MKIEEAVEILKEDLEHTKKANECGLATRGEFNQEIEAIETVLKELDWQNKIINEATKEIEYWKLEYAKEKKLNLFDGEA